MSEPLVPAAPRPPFDAPEAPVLRCPSCGARGLASDRACAYCGSLLSTRRCPVCFALSPREAHRCGRCGRDLPAETLRSDWEASCPDCRTPLVSRASGATAYDECARCGGLFVGREAFESVTRDADARARALSLEQLDHRGPPAPPARFHYRSCPVCHKLMTRTNYAGGSGIVVDVCHTHGVWLDRGELTAIVDFLESGGWDRVKRSERDRLIDQVSTLESRKRIAEGWMPVAVPTGNSILRDVLGWLVEFLRGR